MEFLKDFMFNIFIVIGLIVVCLALIWCMLELLNRIFKFSKYIIMYLEHKRFMELYDLRNTLVATKEGRVLQTCITDLDEQIEILEKAIASIKNTKELQKKFSK